MSMWQDICVERSRIPDFATSAKDVLIGLSMALALAPITCTDSLKSKRLTFVKMAAIAVQGIEFVDDEIEEEAEKL